MSAHDATEATYATEPSYAPVNVVLDNDEKEARAEARLHQDDHEPDTFIEDRSWPTEDGR